MPQFSLPQSGLVTAGDGDDCGPYTSNEWAAILIAANRSGGMIVTGAAAPPGLPATQTVPNVGVYYAYADRLAVTSPGASQISIATGVCIVDGRVSRNDTAITATPITNPAANPRIDRVVIRQNYTGVDYTSVNAAALVVDFNTARICIISGAEAVGPVAPTLTQDEDRATYWDIPLYQYEIAVAGTITNLTDEREWVDAMIHRVSVPAGSGYNATDGTPITSIYDEGVEFPDSKICNSGAMWRAPSNYISGASVKSVWVPQGNGFMYITSRALWQECEEAYATHTDSLGLAQVTATNGIVTCVQELTLSPVTTEDIFWFYVNRDAVDALDTVGAEVWFWGWVVEYLGYGRR